jgi:hypothetical protein
MPLLGKSFLEPLLPESAGRADHRRPAQRRPRRLPLTRRRGLDPGRRDLDPGQREIHRLHGLRPQADRQRQEAPGATLGVAVVPAAVPPGPDRPGHLGRRPDRRGPAREHEGRGDGHHPARLPLPAPSPDPLQRLPARMHGSTRRDRQGRPYSYFICSHDPANPRLDQLPLARDILVAAPDHVREAICTAFDVHAPYRKDLHRVTIWATITPATSPPSPP